MAVKIDETKCIKCGTCKNVCPMEVYDFDNKTDKMVPDNSKCVSCGLCINMCPVGAISFVEEKEEK
ncbi:MAG: 4Fe-4S binding protein [Clostridia bacterium]|nr:4Fe-4S binding protein [Clostridia bacterium]